MRIVWTLFAEGGFYSEVNWGHSSDGNYREIKEFRDGGGGMGAAT